MKSLPLHQLYKACVLKDLPFKTTRQLEPLAEIVGKNRAQEAVRFALAMPHGGYNVYAVGRNGLGKRTMMLRYLEHHVDTLQQSHDWCYVANFEEPRNPKLLQLPGGMGTQLKQDMEKLMTRLVKTIPQTFDSDSFLERSEQLKNDYGKRQEDELAKVAAQAKRKKVSLTVTTPGGYRLVAMNGDEPHTAESFQALTEEQRDKYRDAYRSARKTLRAYEAQLIAAGIIPDPTWEEPLPPPLPGSPGRQAMDEAEWVIRYLLPWVGRRLTGRSSGDGRNAKRPEYGPPPRDA